MCTVGGSTQASTPDIFFLMCCNLPTSNIGWKHSSLDARYLSVCVCVCVIKLQFPVANLCMCILCSGQMTGGRGGFAIPEFLSTVVCLSVCVRVRVCGFSPFSFFKQFVRRARGSTSALLLFSSCVHTNGPTPYRSILLSGSSPP